MKSNWMFMTGSNQDINERDGDLKCCRKHNDVNESVSCRKRLIPVTSMTNENSFRKNIYMDRHGSYCWGIMGHDHYSNQQDEEATTRLINSSTVNAAIKRESFDILANSEKSTCLSKKIVIGAIIILAVTVAIIVAAIYRNDGKKLTGNDEDDVELIPDPEIPPPTPLWSKLRKFKGGGAVAADVLLCAEIGKSILKKNGTAVDAVIAAALCSGLGTMQNMGLGGGFIMTIYERSTGKAFYLNARDSAPLAAYSGMYANKTKYASQKGALAITVPGEIAGYWAAHQRFGKLPWAELFTDTIELCENGWNLSRAMYDDLGKSRDLIYGDPILKSMFVNDTTNTFKHPGSLIKPKQLCNTLRILSEKGAAEFYNGTLGRTLIDDIEKLGGILTMKDLQSYKIKWEEPLQSRFSDGSKLFTAGLPGSGPLLVFVTNILDQYNFSSDSLNGVNNTIETYHRMTEAFKYAYAYRSKMGDTDYVDISDLLKNMTSWNFARLIKEKISDNRTWIEPTHYGAEDGFHEDHGTAHLSVISQNGDAVSLTSSINIFFGCGIVSERTGILFNSGMDDFSIPSVINYFGLPGVDKNNFVDSGKRPVSSMVPTIVVGPDGNVRMVIGAAGGTKITTSTAYVIARYMWMNNNIKEAIDAPRIHHQLFPMQLEYQYGIVRPVIEGLKKLGHKTYRYKGRGSVVVGLVQDRGTIYGAGDYRRFGDVAGID